MASTFGIDGQVPPAQSGSFVDHVVHFTCETEMDFLILGMRQPQLDDHLDRQWRSDPGERDWLFSNPVGKRRIVACRTATDFDKARAELGNGVDCAKASDSDLPLLIQSSDAMEVWDGAGVHAIDGKTARQIDAKLNRERFGELRELLEEAKSAAKACHYLKVRDDICRHDVDLYLANDWPLEMMPWSVDIPLDWTDARVCHCEGTLIFNEEDEWSCRDLKEQWLEHCGVRSEDALAPEQKEKLVSWLSEAAVVRDGE
jgi:hypothetical protein